MKITKQMLEAGGTPNGKGYAWNAKQYAVFGYKHGISWKAAGFYDKEWSKELYDEFMSYKGKTRKAEKAKAKKAKKAKVDSLTLL